MRAAVQDSEFAALKPRRRRTLAVAAAALTVGLALGLAVQWPGTTKPPPAAVVAQSVETVTAAPPVTPEPPPPQSAPTPPSHLAPGQAERIERYSPAGHRLLAERIAATRALLDRAPDEGYSIELFTTDNSDPARMERFLVRARDFVQLAELFVIPVEDAGQYRLRVLYGEFASRDEAAAAGKRLPPRYQQAFRTELRSFGELRRQL